MGVSSKRARGGLHLAALAGLLSVLPLAVWGEQAPVPAPTWQPPAPAQHDRDWLRLTSGEWVGGTIEKIEDETVYLDSDELDDLEIDWEDVDGLSSPHRNTYRFAGRIIVTGTATLQGGVMRIDTGSGVREFPRDDLFEMIEGGLRELDYWSFELGLGLSVRSGNSDQTDGNLRTELARETPLTEILVSYETTQSVVDGEDVTDNQQLVGKFIVDVTERVFVVAPFAEAYRDPLQNIELRTTVAAGVGYDLIERPRAEWDVMLGGGYQRTQYDEVEVDEDGSADDAAVLFESTLELDPTGDIEWDTSYRLALVVTDVGKTNHRLESVVSIDLGDIVDLDVAFTWDRIEDPTADSDGREPESNDFRTTVGLSIDY